MAAPRKTPSKKAPGAALLAPRAQSLPDSIDRSSPEAQALMEKARADALARQSPAGTDAALAAIASGGQEVFAAHRDALVLNAIWDSWDVAHAANDAEDPHLFLEQLDELGEAELAAVLAPSVTVEPEPEEAVVVDPEEAAFQAYKAACMAMDPDEPRYVAGSRAPKLRSNGHPLEPGDLVPGAVRFPRLQSWVDQGRIVKA